MDYRTIFSKNNTDIYLLLLFFCTIMKYRSLIFSFLSFIPLVFSFDIFNFFSQCGNDYDFHYKTPHKYLSMSEYIDSLNSNRFIQTFIEELILDGTVNDLGELIRSFTEYIVLIGFGVIFLICIMNYLTISMACFWCMLVYKVRFI